MRCAIRCFTIFCTLVFNLQPAFTGNRALKQLRTATLTAILSVTSLGAWAEEDAGAYLAARQAQIQNDFAAAAQYYSQALTRDRANPVIMESAVASFISLGQIDKAITISRSMDELGFNSQIASMAIIAKSVADGKYSEVLDRIAEDRGLGSLGDGLVSGWVKLGLGDMRAASEEFDKVAAQRGLSNFALYHKALALASVGDFEAANDIFAGNGNAPLQRTRRGVIAWSQILSQLERNDEALALLNEVFGSNQDPEITSLSEALGSGEAVTFSLIQNPQDGVAEVFYSIGQALLSESGEQFTLLYARAAEYLSPSHVDTIIMSAELLEVLGRYELATEVYNSVPRDHPSYAASEIGRAEALRRAEKADAAIEVLEQLRKSHPELPMVHVSTGDLYRQNERYEEAIDAYDFALKILEERKSDQWFVHYARAISYERLGIWESAEADFRKALELNPDHPQVMNYLGYSLVEKRIKLDEALNMIERAVKAQPDSGHIVDSLGWVLYRLGRYEEAIGHMERAAELMPVDPVVNDHLGDVLWAVGRFFEAEFQWKRALSFVDEDKPSPDIDPDRIRRKLEVGLDVVLEEEGAEPLKVAEDL